MFYTSLLSVAFATLSLFSPAVNGRAIDAAERRQDGSHWINTWTSMPQLVEASNMPPAPFVRDLNRPRLNSRNSNMITEFRQRNARCDAPPNPPHVGWRTEDQDHHFQHFRRFRPSHHHRLCRSSCRWCSGRQWHASLTSSSHHRWWQDQLHSAQGSGRY